MQLQGRKLDFDNAAIDEMRGSALDAVYRKIDWRLLPFLATLWVIAWIDRVNIGFAKLQMLDDLKFSEAAYGFGAGVFFLGYFLFETPSNLLLMRIGAKKTLARITIGWGVVCVCMMFVRSTEVFYGLRFLLGVFEAGFYPGVIFYLTSWYPSARRARAFGLFMSASAFAGVVGGPLAGTILTGFNGVNGWAGWQWLFLIEGTPSVVAGIVTLFYLTDRPQGAQWLTGEERALVQGELARDGAAAGPREHGVWNSLRDLRLWLLIAMYFAIVSANSALTFWGPSVVRELGFADPATIGWVMAAIYLVGGAGMIMNGVWSDRAGESRRHCGLATLVGAIAIAALAVLMPVGKILPLLALGAAIVGTMSAIPVFWQMPNRIFAGAAAAASVAIINSFANLAGFVAPWLIGELKTDFGGLSVGLLTIAAVEAVGAFLILGYRMSDVRQGSPREVREGA